MSKSTIARHLGLGSSMVRTSHRSSEGCGFGLRLGLRNRLSKDNLSLTNVLRTSVYSWIFVKKYG